MGNKLYWDLETFNEKDLKQCGSFLYATTAKILMATYAYNDEPVQLWLGTEEMPSKLKAAFTSAEWTKVGFNSIGFDRLVLKESLGIDSPVEQHYDVMFQSLLHGMPKKLAKVAEALGFPEDKKKHKFSNFFTQPHKGIRNLPKDHPENWQVFCDYAIRDTVVTRVAHKLLPVYNITDFEKRLIVLDSIINARGLLVDVDLVRASKAIVDRLKPENSALLHRMTNGKIETMTKRAKLKTYVLEEFGYQLPDTRKETIAELIDNPLLDKKLRDFLELLSAGSISVEKNTTILNAISKDNRIRGMTQFCGANRTRRWAGRLVQMQNLPRPSLSPVEIDVARQAIKGGYVNLIFDNEMEVCKSVIRSSFIPREGCKYVIADWSNIEGRIVSWLCEDHNKINAFRAFDNNKGHDMYKLAYAKVFNIPVDKVDAKGRFIGKTLELSMGYGGGVGAFLNNFKSSGLNLDEVVKVAKAAIPEYVLVKAERYYDTAIAGSNKTQGITKEQYIVLDSLKDMWRSANPSVPKMWRNLEQAVKIAITNRSTLQVGRLTIDMYGNYLRIKLPSGGYLSYYKPKVSTHGNITYTKTSDFITIATTYGGSIFENICQAIARDILGEGMLRIELRGYSIVLHIHDEIVCEVPANDNFTAEELVKMMVVNENWSEGLPLAAVGHETLTFGKG